MNSKSHVSAKPSHYDQSAEHYDVLNEETSKQINQTIEKILEKYKLKTVLDFTCGTGSQAFWLAKRGHNVTGCDISDSMLKVAKKKPKNKNITLLKGDMRTKKIGKFDACITIFNSIGHLTKQDFEKAIRNIHENLKGDGIYIFDIFNLNYLLKDDNITKFTIDWFKKSGNKMVREIQYSTINKQGIMASYTTSIIEYKTRDPKVTKSAQTLQTYSAAQLKEILKKNGFKVLRQCDIDGTRFSDTKTERILTIAKKV